MNLRDLHYFVILAKYQHFGEAARHCFVSQPTLSMQIKKLEEELGVILFERSNKQVMLTDEGRHLLLKAQIILNEAAEFKESARSLSDPFSGMLRLAIIPTLGPYLLPTVMPAIQNNFPKLRVWLIEDQTERLIEKLTLGSIDAAIMATPIHADFNTQLLFQEPFYFVCKKNYPIAKSKVVSTKELKKQPVLLLEEGHCLRDQAIDICHMTQAKTSIDFTATSLETLRLMVQAGLGVTLLPALAVKNPNPELAVIPFEKPVPFRQIALFSRLNSSKRACLEAIAELIKETINDELSLKNE